MTRIRMLLGFLAMLLTSVLSVGIAEAGPVDPLPVCVANALAPTSIEGQAAPCWVDLNRILQVNVAKPLAGEDVPTDVMKVEQRFGYTNITLAAPTTTVVKSGPGFLHQIVWNKAVATGVVTCYDNTAGSGTVIATVTEPATLLQSHYVLSYDVAFSVGLTCVTSTAAQDITVSAR